MPKLYAQPGVEVLGHLHDLTLYSCKNPPFNKSVAANSDGLYCQNKKNGPIQPIHS